jgi:hypothetical protein
VEILQDVPSHLLTLVCGTSDRALLKSSPKSVHRDDDSHDGTSEANASTVIARSLPEIVFGVPTQYVSLHSILPNADDL